jgi:hypothetical protein
MSVALRIFYCCRMLVFGWPTYLLTHVTGRKYGSRTNHFEPNSPLFDPKERMQVALSDLVLFTWIATLVYAGQHPPPSLPGSALLRMLGPAHDCVCVCVWWWCVVQAAPLAWPGFSSPTVCLTSWSTSGWSSSPICSTRTCACPTTVARYAPWPLFLPVPAGPYFFWA